LFCKGNKPVTRLFDRSYIEFLDGNINESTKFAEKYILACNDQNLEKKIEPPQLILLGENFIESAQFSRAIEVLTEAIQKDPTNKEAYFHRSMAYFELGNFDDCFSDYSLANRGKTVFKSDTSFSDEFKNALIIGLGTGCLEGALEFFPSLCTSVHGLQKALWVNAVTMDYLFPAPYFASATFDMMKAFIDVCKNINYESIDGWVDELKVLYQQFDQLNDSEKGLLMGQTIGKYGVEIFAGSAICQGVNVAAKSMQSYRNLRNANRICTLETMAVSKSHRRELVSKSLGHASQRENFLKRTRIHKDKQNKHILGSHNFEEGKGIIHIELAELERMVKEKAGTGQYVTGEFGQAGYKERIDFGKIIGEYALQKEGKTIKYIPTTKGSIIYAKDSSVHVVPAKPDIIK
jgi:tetratricopeptide (TPR) repeat protein